MSYRFVPQDAVAERWQDEWLSERKLGHRVHAFEGDTVILLPPTPASTFTQYFAFWLWGVFVPLYPVALSYPNTGLKAASMSNHGGQRNDRAKYTICAYR